MSHKEFTEREEGPPIFCTESRQKSGNPIILERRGRTWTLPGTLSSFWGASTSRAEAKRKIWAQPAAGTPWKFSRTERVECQFKHE
jgi:hypothetical protein